MERKTRELVVYMKFNRGSHSPCTLGCQLLGSLPTKVISEQDKDRVVRGNRTQESSFTS